MKNLYKIIFKYSSGGAKSERYVLAKDVPTAAVAIAELSKEKRCEISEVVLIATKEKVLEV